MRYITFLLLTLVMVLITMFFGCESEKPSQKPSEQPITSQPPPNPVPAKPTPSFNAPSVPIATAETRESTEVEKHVIEQLKKTMHDPYSFEVISISSVEMQDYTHFDKFAYELRYLWLKTYTPKDPLNPFKAYAIKYRARNAFNALRIASSHAIAGETLLFGMFCYLFDEAELAPENHKKVYTKRK